ncbi:hypothetical protein ACH0BO_04160 [Brevibacterium luteolum]|uniref:hypothetical protein n=1 Tax=Brevibacterium luteolum TaxID=199591 RepID=UPI00387A422D
MSLYSLKRYSKRRGPGDQTSGGRGKLLRSTSNLTRVQLMVRETLQNSWDARTDDWYPAFGVRMHRATAEMREVLTGNVFTDLPPSLGDLRDSMNNPDLYVLEIFDRGTTGLDGPVRAGEEPPPGSPKNFSSLVFDIGTTKDTPDSGGTYGFGKTAAFEVSQAHSVVYWSVCEDHGSLDHRLIAASLHSPYSEGGARYTGAHWWGDYDGTDIVPVRGEDAERLGEQLFRTHFGDEETGTSILIIDPVVAVDLDEGRVRRPVRSSSDAEILVEQVAEALARNAWPKTFPEDEEHPPMIFELYMDDEKRDVAAEIRGRYQRYANALIKVREEQDQQVEGSAQPDPPGIIKSSGVLPIKLRPPSSMKEPPSAFFGTRTDRTVGHLYLSLAVGDADDRDTPKNQLCMMRSKTELVVFYESPLEFDSNHLQWHGVFKPTPECDLHFASSEPATHDAWTPNAAETEVSAYVVNRAMFQIRQKTRDFLSEGKPAAVSEVGSVRQVANALRSFVPLSDAAPGPQQPKLTSARGSRKTTSARKADVEVFGAQRLLNGAGQELRLRAKSASGRDLRVEMAVRAVTTDGRLELEADEFGCRWSSSKPQFESRASEVRVPSGTLLNLRVWTKTAAVLEVSLNAEEVR